MQILKNGMYGYTIPPIDFFDGCIGLEDYIKSYDGCDTGEFGMYQKNERINDIITKLIIGMSSFEYWEGDIRGKIEVFSVPAEGMTEIGFILKQDNNGTTFIISPVPLPHLDYLDE